MKRIFFAVFNLFCIILLTLNVFAADPRIEICDFTSNGEGISVTYGNSEDEYIYLNETVILLMVNGDFISDADTIISNGRTLVPLRVISQKLGADVVWSNDERSIAISQSGNAIKMYIDSNTVFLNGKEIYTDVPPQIVNSITYVPVRLIGEALGADVGYYDGFRFPLIWVSNRTDEIKISEEEAIKIAEDVYFNKFLPYIADDGVIPNTDININEVTPDNFSEKVLWTCKYGIKCVSDFGEYYCISYFQYSYPQEDMQYFQGSGDILVDKYNGNYYPVSGFSFCNLKITESNDFGLWGTIFI